MHIELYFLSKLPPGSITVADKFCVRATLIHVRLQQSLLAEILLLAGALK